MKLPNYTLKDMQDICNQQSFCNKDCPLYVEHDEYSSCALTGFNDVDVVGEPIRVAPITAETDNVNHPQHYTSGCGFECIDILKMVLSDDEFEGFCIGNAIKYIWRHQLKGGMEDIRKARWYLDTILERHPIYATGNRDFMLLSNKVDKLLNQ